MYEQNNAKLNLTVSLARKLAQTMVTQDEFNRDYFTALTSYSHSVNKARWYFILRQKRRLRWTMEVTKVPKKIVTVIEPKRSMTVDKEKYRQKKVAAYCRVSTDSEEQLVSYANQKKVYTEMIASRKDWCFAACSLTRVSPAQSRQAARVQ